MGIDKNSKHISHHITIKPINKWPIVRIQKPHNETVLDWDTAPTTNQSNQLQSSTSSNFRSIWPIIRMAKFVIHTRTAPIPSPDPIWYHYHRKTFPSSSPRPSMWRGEAQQKRFMLVIRAIKATTISNKVNYRAGREFLRTCSGTNRNRIYNPGRIRHGDGEDCVIGNEGGGCRIIIIITTKYRIAAVRSSSASQAYTGWENEPHSHTQTNRYILVVPEWLVERIRAVSITHELAGSPIGGGRRTEKFRRKEAICCHVPLQLHCSANRLSVAADGFKQFCTNGAEF